MNLTNYAIIENGIVTNIVIWDGGSEWTPPTDAIAVPIPPSAFVSIGYAYSEGAFSAS